MVLVSRGLGFRAWGSSDWGLLGGSVDIRNEQQNGDSNASIFRTSIISHVLPPSSRHCEASY